jgi:hypothetical protein
MGIMSGLLQRQCQRDGWPKQQRVVPYSPTSTGRLRSGVRLPPGEPVCRPLCQDPPPGRQRLPGRRVLPL